MNATEESGRHWDDEVGIERYVLTLIAWWREIILGAFLLGLLGGVAALSVRAFFPDYKASADVAIIPTHTDVAIDDRFRAVSGDARIRDRRNRTSRRYALLGLVHQGDVARTVFSKLADLWKDDEYSEADLLESISAVLVTDDDVSPRNRSESDLIRITASSDSPEKAAIIANTWASEFVRAVNLLYRPVPEDVIVRVDNELTISEKRFTDLQVELEALLARSDTGELQRQIEVNNVELQSLREFWHRTSTTLFTVQLNDSLLSLEHSYETRRKVRRLLADLKTHRAQIEEQIKAGVASDVTGFSNQLLYLQTYTLSGNLPEGLEIILDGSRPNSASIMDKSAEVDSIITALMERIEQLDQLIKSETTDLISGVSSVVSSEFDPKKNRLLMAIAVLERYNRRLGAQLEKADAEVKNLIHKRDSARTTMETLRNEITELRLTSAASPSELRLASRAVEPSRSSRPSPMFIAVVIGAIGLLTLIFVAFILNSVGVRPFLENRRTESVV